MKHYKNIVITGAITTAKEESLEIYKILVEKLSQYTDNIYSPIDTIKFKGTSEAMYKRAMKMIQDADLVIAEMSNPSTGQGMELQEAVRLGLPIIVIAKKGTKISNTVLGSGKVMQVILYDEKEEIKIFE